MLAAIIGIQIIVHICLTDVVVPANAQIFFEQIFTVIAFDPIEITPYVEALFNLKASDQTQLEGNFVQLGYESSFLLINIGSLLLFLPLQLLYTGILLLLKLPK